MSDDDLFDSPGGPDGELPKDQWGRYKLPHPETGKVAGHTRVTTFAKSIADTYALSMWQQRMAIKGLTIRRDLYARVAATPIEDRDALNSLAEDAKEAASARAAANLGTAMHAFAEHADKTGEMPADIPGDLFRILAARQAALGQHRIRLVPDMIERTVFVPRFGIVGTFDRWGWVGWDKPDMLPNAGLDPGEILDDKTGRDLTYGWNEIAIQLAAYANASHVLNKEIFWEDWNRLTAGLRAGAAPKTMPTRCWEPMPPTRTDRAIVIHMPVAQAVDNPTAPPVVTVYQVDIATGWEAAQLCHDVREWRKRKGLAVPLTVTVPARTPELEPALAAARAELAEANRLTDLAFATSAPDEVLDEVLDAEQQAMAKIENMTTRPPTWSERIFAATQLADLSQIWREATAKGEWTAELEQQGKEKASSFHTL